MDDFDNITCEEFYLSDAERQEWLDELELDDANDQLQVIADQQALARVEVEYEFLYFGA